MATQPDSLRSASQREQNVELLSQVLEADEHRLRWQTTKHAELPDDADDALQSAYALFLERYNGMGEPLPWLYTTVKREAWAIRRRGSRRHERGFDCLADGEGFERDLSEALPSDEPTPEERVSRDELLSERRQALAALKHERQALWLLGLGLSYGEICETTGWTYTKVSPGLSLGRAALRDLVADPAAP